MSISEDDVWSDEFNDTLEELGLGKTLRPDMDSPTNKGANLCFGGASSDDLGGTLAGTFAGTMNSTLDNAQINGKTLRWVRGETIGSGTMGTVFQAMDPINGTIFAVKEVSFNPENSSD